MGLAHNPEKRAAAPLRLASSIFFPKCKNLATRAKLKSDAAGKARGSILDFFIPKPHRDDDGRGPPPAGGSFSGAGGGGGGITA